MSEASPRPRRRFGCLIGLLVLIALGVIGYYVADALGYLPGGDEATDEAALPAPSAPAPAEPVPAPEPEPEPTAIEELGASILIAEGWEQGDPVPAMAIFPAPPAADPEAPPAEPVAPPLVLQKPGAGVLPLLLIGRIPDETLGERQPETFTKELLAQLKAKLQGLTPALTSVAEAELPEPPALWASARQILAKGAFTDLGIAQGIGRFIVATDADGGVWMAVAFSAGEALDEEVLGMIRSLTALEAGDEPAAEPAEEEPVEGEPAEGEVVEEGEPAPAEEEPAPVEETEPGAAAEEAAPEHGGAEPR